jgi:DHA1 family multidrug resistance protein-like MFS transporter
MTVAAQPQLGREGWGNLLETWRKNLYVVLILMFVGQACFTLVTPFLPYVMKSLDVSENLGLWSGMAYSSTFLTSAIVAPIWGALADKYGKKTQILRSGVLTAVLYAMYPMAKTPMQFVVLRGLTGLMSGFSPSATSLVATNTPEHHMGYALGLLQAVSAAGTISGPLLGGILMELTGIAVTFRLSACILVAITLISMLVVREEVTGGHGRINVMGDIKQAFTNKSLVMVFACLFLVRAGTQVTQPTLVLYIDNLAGGKESSVVSGLIYSIAGLGTVLGATVIARKTSMTESGSSSRLFLFGILGSAISMFFQGIWVALLPLAFLRFTFGAFNGMLTASGNVLVATSVNKDFRGRAFGVLSGVLPLGGFVGPVLGGSVSDVFGIGSSFYAATLVFLLAGVIFSMMTRSRSRLGEETS